MPKPPLARDYRHNMILLLLIVSGSCTNLYRPLYVDARQQNRWQSHRQLNSRPTMQAIPPVLSWPSKEFQNFVQNPRISEFCDSAILARISEPQNPRILFQNPRLPEFCLESQNFRILRFWDSEALGLWVPEILRSLERWCFAFRGFEITHMCWDTETLKFLDVRILRF